MNITKSIKLANERFGLIKANNNGSLMEIVKYNKATDIWVKFLEFGNLVNTTYRQFCTGEVWNAYEKSVYGVGFMGDGAYNTTKINDKHIPQYSTWRSMIKRCYDNKYHKKQPTYIECSVAEEWHNFQVFAKWYDENYYEIDGEKMELDKDILSKGNKIYSPDTCVFVPKSINSLFLKCNASRGEMPIGVHFHKNNKNYVARCMVGKGNKRKSLGSYSTPEEAFNAYKTFKENHIKEIAEEYKEQLPNKLYEAMLNYEVDIND